MKLTFLGKVTEEGESPTLYASDQGTLVVQGWKVVDQDALATMKLPQHETAVEVPRELMQFLPESEAR
ncbi:hypothetical protein [Pseudonocardia spinosispora]|uniref:hypothetical protein n=1 Tax=Pseudonocardia spinosispora TaxID=103441 RepID=UPI00048A5CCE|nr:hypothetical protein [Pseudonocardia spinosispora]